MKTKANINPNKRKFIFLGLGLGVLAVGGFSYWYFFLKPNTTESSEADFMNLNEGESTTVPKVAPKISKPKAAATTPKPASNAITVPAPKTSGKDFPLKDKSKGELVKKLQEALIQKYGKAILPPSGADGKFGPGTAKALASKGFPTVIDETTYNKIVGIVVPTTVPANALSATDKDNIDIVKNIWLNSTIKKLDPLLKQLNRITSVAHYIKLNELFKTIRLNGVRQTIVNGSLSAFSDATSKQFISEALKKIGLKYYDEKWNLSGINDRRIITNQETTICGSDGRMQKVPEQTVLGIEQIRGRFKTRFRSLDNQTLYVPTKHINYV
ncbi:MAG: hypothetical protein Q8L81_05740 [Bacteroidota bacterium]|nr:hypothetical protein [Bacteroidota bacterium]